MRSIILSLFLFLAYNMQGQFEVKTNALGLATNYYNGQFELLLNDKSGLELEVGYRETPWIARILGSEIETASVKTTVSYKYYLGGDEPTSGLFLGPYLRFGVGRVNNVPSVVDEGFNGKIQEKLEVNRNAFAIGLQAGQKITIRENLILEYFAGFGYGVYNYLGIRNDIPEDDLKYYKVESNSFTWPWDFRLGVGIGYRVWR